MEERFIKEALTCERRAASAAEQVAIEGETALAGSMRDAVTVLSVQAQAHIAQTQAGEAEAGVRGGVSFQVLYTQGDLTRIRSIETVCDFEHTLRMAGVTPQMRICARVSVLEAGGTATSGRIRLRALLEVDARAYETVECTAVSGLRAEEPGVYARMQTVESCAAQCLGGEKTLVRGEFDLPDRLGVQEVLCATGTAQVTDITGGSGRVGVSGTVTARVLHRMQENGVPLAVTEHELPFTVTLPAQLLEGERPMAQACVLDVAADSEQADGQSTLRVEAEVSVQLERMSTGKTELLEDIYSSQGEILEPEFSGIELISARESAQARESVRLNVQLPPDAPPAAVMLAAFAQAIVSGAQVQGKRMTVQGVMNTTLVYLPADSDIPHSLFLREPFEAAFPAGLQGEAVAEVEVLECTAAVVTSDRAEVRLVLGLRADAEVVSHVRLVTDVRTAPPGRQEHGFVLVWPAPQETRWETAKRLRVPQDSLRQTESGALLAFRR